MKELDHKVNIIPIIAKADTVARSELEDFKMRVSCHVTYHVTCGRVSR